MKSIEMNIDAVAEFLRDMIIEDTDYELSIEESLDVAKVICELAKAKADLERALRGV